MIRVILRNLPLVEEKEFIAELAPIQDEIIEAKEMITFGRYLRISIGLATRKNPQIFC